jgi:dTDP-4-amino-4,6-dideoxygalactose transaminase
MVKLAGMLYRDVNIALANELAGYAEEVGVDLPSLLPAINSDGEAQLLQPGIGVGGHCTPVYPYFVIRDAERRGVPMTLAARSRRINDDQAGHVLDVLERSGVELSGRKVLVLGLAFRPNVKETIYSTTFLLRDELVRRGADVVVADPLFTADEVEAHGLVAAGPDDECDVVVLSTAHAEYLQPDFAAMRSRGVVAVVDGRNAWRADEVRAADLTYVGVGQPVPVAAAPRPLPVARPALGVDEEMAAADVVRSGWLLQGRQVGAFEEEFAAFTGAPHACAVSSGTAALHLALLALGVGPGDEVVTVSHSFIATANSVALTGAAPVFVDVGQGGFNVDVAALDAAVGPRTRALVVVHQFGMPCDLTGVLDVARRHGLPVVEDAACAIGSEIRLDGGWEPIGAPHGDLATFSFHPRKVLTTGEGGMVVTRSAELARIVTMLRQHGSLDAVDHPRVGLNYRMTDVQAAIGRRQLRRLPELVTERRRLASRYDALLVGSGLSTPVEPPWARSNWQSYCVLLSEGIDVARVLRGLQGFGVSARGGIGNAHLEAAHAGAQARGPLTNSEAAARRGLCLPLFPGMTESDQERVVSALLTVIDDVRQEHADV